RDPEASAQSGAAEELRRARRVLGRMDRARSRRQSRQPDADHGVVRARQAERTRARGLSAGADRAGTARARRSQGDGQGDLAALVGVIASEAKQSLFTCAWPALLRLFGALRAPRNDAMDQPSANPRAIACRAASRCSGRMCEAT